MALAVDHDTAITRKLFDTPEENIRESFQKNKTRVHKHFYLKGYFFQNIDLSSWNVLYT